MSEEWSARLPEQGTLHMLAIDVPNIVHRAWYGHVNTKRHEPERAAPTALKQLARLLRARQPSHAVFAGEGMGSVRKALFDGYKAGRPPKPDGLLAAEAVVHAALASADVPFVRVAGLEADDVLAGAVIVARGQHLPVVVVTNDKDAEQLAAEDVVIWDGAERVLDGDAVATRWGVPAWRIAEHIAIAGQSGDGIPGGKGLGEKAAVEILNSSHRPLELLLKDGGVWWVPQKYQKKFVKSRETIRTSFELARLRGAEAFAKMHLENFEVRPLFVAQALMNAAQRDPMRDEQEIW